jgi:hypothetical protein
MMNYAESAGAQASMTSIAAAASIKEKRVDKIARILLVFFEGTSGTAEEVSKLLPYRRSYVQPRICEMKWASILIPVGRSKNESGLTAEILTLDAGIASILRNCQEHAEDLDDMKFAARCIVEDCFRRAEREDERRAEALLASLK